MDEGNISDADGDFSNTPIFNFNDDQLNFDTNRVDNANDNYGSVSAFLPKSLLRGLEASERVPFVYFAEERIHPPSIRPISSICSCKTI